MSDVVRFPSSVELSGTSPLVVAPVTGSEVTLIQFKGLDVDANSIAEISGNTQATLYIGYNMGAATKIQLRMYGSYLENPGTSDWYQETVESDTAGVATLDKHVIELTSGTNALIAYHVPIGAWKSFKVTSQSTGTTTNSSLAFLVALRTN